MMQGYGYAQQPRQEVPLFAAGGVEVTTARFVCWNQTYPMASISSVSTFQLPPNTGDLQGWQSFFVLGVVVCLAITGVSAMVGAAGSAVTFGMFAAANVTGAILVGKAMRRRMPSYGVMISTAGMQVRAVVSQDMAFVQAIIHAMNHALSMR